MLKKLLLIVMLAAVSMSAEARRGPTALMDPPALTVPQGATQVDVEKAIITAGISRDWRVLDKKPGLITLQYAPREFSVNVTVSYDAQHISIAYSDSTNLEYGQEDGHPVIHPNYNRWVNNLAHDIESLLAVAAIK
jgi:hypothetical protein